MRQRGAEICKISCIPDEMEVLLKSGKKYKVIDVVEDFMIYDVDYSQQNSFTKVIIELLE
ncbi:hypothetical protein Q4517_09450 [Tenacibaculum sp. 1_MG-2023]|uniref:hypothetical protein n=1 Tax=Tenacibaculum sp. 1_MG-2023 TaxID=3062653 RepID=UPI0026E40A54|nr:hypothetical protein [Tenacibaculum sp. 1_MG-2023]MDO6675774.1 hypothetical protein [Tenacibaculum sp. 1_MG-2023]